MKLINKITKKQAKILHPVAIILAILSNILMGVLIYFTINPSNVVVPMDILEATAKFLTEEFVLCALILAPIGSITIFLNLNLGIIWARSKGAVMTSEGIMSYPHDDYKKASFPEYLKN